jgi:spermidine/putrescine transport system permease protein
LPRRNDHHRIARPALLLTPAIGLLTLLLVVPVGFVLVYSFWLRTATGAVRPTITLVNWGELFSDGYYWLILGRTVRLGVTTTLLCAVLGYVVAYFLAMTRVKRRILLILLLLLPFWISFVIRTMSWIQVLGATGVVNTALRQLGLIDEPLKLLYNDV